MSKQNSLKALSSRVVKRESKLSRAYEFHERHPQCGSRLSARSLSRIILGRTPLRQKFLAVLISLPSFFVLRELEINEKERKKEDPRCPNLTKTCREHCNVPNQPSDQLGQCADYDACLCCIYVFRWFLPYGFQRPQRGVFLLLARVDFYSLSLPSRNLRFVVTV